MLTLFRVVYLCVAVLFVVDALLIVGSLSLAPRGASFPDVAIVSAVVAAGFLVAAFVTARIRSRLSRVCEIERKRAGTALDRDLGALLGYLALAGLIVGTILGVGTVGIVQRIQDGMAVFG